MNERDAEARSAIAGTRAAQRALSYAARTPIVRAARITPRGMQIDLCSLSIRDAADLLRLLRRHSWFAPEGSGRLDLKRPRRVR